MSSNTYRDALREAMGTALENIPNSFIIGQGVTDFKGIFGTTLGFVEKYPNRIIEAPLSEDSIAGICIGSALNGMYPINTHIRADFGILTLNQLINLAAKYRYMFGGLFEVPTMSRMVIGRSWGQGAQHSQSIQTLLSHIPGLVVIMPSTPRSVKESYRFATEIHKGPVVSLEHRLLYDLEFEDTEIDLSEPIFGSIKVSHGSDITVVATSVMVLEARRAKDYLEKFGLSIEIIDLHSISHPDFDLIYESVKRTGKLLVLDTSWSSYGVSAEINRQINLRDPRILKSPSVTLGMAPCPCPTSKYLEDLFYPDLRDICESVTRLCEASTEKIPLPKHESMTDYYKHFKGPF